MKATRFLQRFEFSRVSSNAILILLWILSQLYLLSLVNDVFWSDTLSTHYVPVLVALILVSFTAEALALGLLAHFAKRFLRVGSSVASKVLALVLLFPCYLYFLLLAVSWALAKLRVGFLDRSILRAFLVDTALIFRHFTHLELLIAAGTLVFPAVLVFILLAISPTEQGEARVGRRSGLFVILVAALFILLRILPQGMPAAERSAYRAFVGHQLLPNLTLFWGWMLPQEKLTVGSNFERNLTPQYTLEEYAARVSARPDRPNVLLIIVEALRSDMIDEEIAGQKVMPTLQALAQSGTRVENVLSQSPESAYSMTSIFTGLYPMKFGIRDTFLSLRYPHARVYDLFSKSGYVTGFFSSANEAWQNMANVTRSPLLDVFFDAETAGLSGAADAHDTGFATALESGRLSTGKLDDAVTIRELTRWIGAQKSGIKPWFAAVSLQASHFPYQQGASISPVFQPSELSSAEENQLSFLYYPEQLAPTLKNRYRNSLHFIDTQIKQTLDALHDSGQDDRTIVVVAGDHGELFHEHGQVTHGSSLYQSALSVPVILWRKGEAFDVRTGTHQLIDIAPSLLAAAALPPYDGFQGRSFLSPASKSDLPVFSSLEGITIQDAVVIGPWKLVFDHRQEHFTLFNLETDPGETNDLSSARMDVLQCLRGVLDEYRSRQLGYYANFALTSKYFAPRYDDLGSGCTGR